MSVMPQQYVVADPGSIHTGVEVLQSDEHKHAPERYPLSQVDFERVKTPFIIGVWILSASIAKIGEFFVHGSIHHKLYFATIYPFIYKIIEKFKDYSDVIG